MKNTTTQLINTTTQLEIENEKREKNNKKKLTLWEKMLKDSE